MKIEKVQTGIASEFYVAGELSRLGYSVAFSFGNTKQLDLIIRDIKSGLNIAIEVKGMQYTKAGNWNINKKKISAQQNMFVVLVNLHTDKKNERPEFFILTIPEIIKLIVDKNKAGKDVKRNYLSYNKVKRKGKLFQDRWDKIVVRK